MSIEARTSDDEVPELECAECGEDISDRPEDCGLCAHCEWLIQL